MKKHFITGLILILPLAITFMIVAFLINFLTNPFLLTTENALNYYGLIDWEHPVMLYYASKALILAILFAFTLLLGALGHWFLQHYLIQLTDLLFHRIPLVNKVYRASQEIVNTIFTPKSTSFTQVVMVPFPGKNSKSLGLITRETLPEGSSSEISHLATVLVPGTPNPTMGFVILYPKEQLVYMNMKPDEALKAIVSCGIILNDISEKKR